MPVSRHQPASRFGGNVHRAAQSNVERFVRSNKEQAGPGEHCAALRGIGARLLCGVLRAARQHQALLPDGGSVSDAGWLQLAAWLAVEQVTVQSCGPCCINDTGDACRPRTAAPEESGQSPVVPKVVDC